MAANEAAPRVALLARAGEACERITAALREAGAEVVLVADPLQAEPDEVRQATPQAILVALDPAIEDAIERYADVLADPDYMVIFEEAEQAAQRTGWDAARWLRHLSAKLHRHNDVLPAGAEAEESLLPTPGPLRSTAAKVDYEEAIAAVTDEAQQRAGAVPRDSGVDGLTGLGAVEPEPPAPAPPAVVAPAWDLQDDEAPAPDAPAPPEGDADIILDATPDAASDFSSYTGSGSDTVSDSDSDPAVLAFSPDSDDAGADEPTFDPERFGRAGQAAEGAGGIEEFLAAQLRQAAEEGEDATAAASDEPAETTPAAPDFSGLRLADEDAGPPALAPVQDACHALLHQLTTLLDRETLTGDALLPLAVLVDRIAAGAGTLWRIEEQRHLEPQPERARRRARRPPDWTFASARRWASFLRHRGEELGVIAALQMQGAAHVPRQLRSGIDELLGHLLRSAVEHGIETPEERLAAGKPAGATIMVKFESAGPSQLRMTIRDDGRGRGPGMTFARRAVARLGGQIAVAARPGQYTQFVIDLPHEFHPHASSMQDVTP